LKNREIHIRYFLVAITLCFSLNLHGLSHALECGDDHGDAEKQECQLCIINTSENKIFSSIIPSEDFNIQNPSEYQTEPKITLQHQDVVVKKFKSDYFNKPPPVYIS
jgi:hypothetical protein